MLKSLNRSQFIKSAILSYILSFVAGVLIDAYYGRQVIFLEFLPTMVFALIFIIVFYCVSPFIVMKYRSG